VGPRAGLKAMDERRYLNKKFLEDKLTHGEFKSLLISCAEGFDD
jgi:hypothetical protein